MRVFLHPQAPEDLRERKWVSDERALQDWDGRTHGHASSKLHRDVDVFCAGISTLKHTVKSVSVLLGTSL